jgi:Cu+-exporting ATPase
MKVEESRAAAKAEYQGRTYYFCSSGCHKSFMTDPANYAKSGGASPTPGGSGTPRR